MSTQQQFKIQISRHDNRTYQSHAQACVCIFHNAMHPENFKENGVSIASTMKWGHVNSKLSKNLRSNDYAKKLKQKENYILFHIKSSIKFLLL